MFFAYMHFFLYFCKVLGLLCTDMACRRRALYLNQGNKIKNHYNERFI